MKHDRRPVPKGDPVCDITGFLRLLKEMEDAGETERMISGDFTGPLFSKAAYNCLIRIGIEGKRAHHKNSYRLGNVKINYKL